MRQNLISGGRRYIAASPIFVTVVFNMLMVTAQEFGIFAACSWWFWPAIFLVLGWIGKPEEDKS
jgi:hypothetical protein